MLLGFFLRNGVFEGLKKSNNLWLASALVEAEVGKDTGSCIPSKLENVLVQCHFRFFKQLYPVKNVLEVCFTEWTLHLKKCYPFHSKMLL